jgi:hypothetical protein
MSLLIMSAVTDESIHLDGLYILLRRDPTAATITALSRKGTN